MKKYINKILFLLTFSALMMSCENEEVVVINEDFTTTAVLSNDNIVLEEANEGGATILTVSWDEPNFGYNAAAEYNILFSLSDSSEETGPESVSAGTELEKGFKTEDLNKVLLNLGAEPNKATELDVTIEIILSKQNSKLTGSSSLTATAYSGVLDLTTPWGIVGDATPNGWPDGNTVDAAFYQTGEAGVYVTYINLSVGEWKIRKDNSWDLNYGSDANDGTLQQNGSNIKVSADQAGPNKVTFDENNLTYTMEKYSWGIVGDATFTGNPSGWDAPDEPLEYDPCSDTWRAVVKLKDGNWKIRQNEEWVVDYGSDAADGNLQAGGGNIPVTAGVYEVIVDFNNLTYSIEKVDVWGVVGSGYLGWDGTFPDFPFTPDYCNKGIFYANNVPLTEGLIKFRLNNDWTVNYGDDGEDGILEAGGADIPISEAGAYDIILDFSNESVPTYTMIKK